MNDPVTPSPEQPRQPSLAPAPAPAGRGGSAKAWAVGGLALITALCCGGAAIGLADSDDKKPTAGGSSPTASDSLAPPTTAAPITTPPSTAPTTTQPTAEPTTAEPTTAAPTTTPPAPKPKVYKGRGDDVVRIPDLTDLAVIKFTCRCSGNTVLHSDGPEGLLVNEIGSYSGKRWINFEDGALTTEFEIEATGSWTLTIGSIEQLATKALSGKASGKGDDVVVLGGEATAVKVTHTRGRSNFAVYAYSLDTGEGGLLINEIGGYSGVRPLTAPAIVQIAADGNWTIAPAWT
ncbi:hypothetical protein [Micromonospora mirobrigensis]|uniref:Uncharacterized protein n=1 Tax=Micromonospora mirobrigensis TaxID=262898 RepID=A0A1C4WT38_9ACTN|nr:hypothetical protein [Micromonospora mirobrigensis]SCE99395.1 hypothetical protein GA0070564_102490 [Micromonospora mirobrigensis]